MQVQVDESSGGRVASLVVGGVERLLTRPETDGAPMAWGSYPMVPWAGRVRRGRFAFEGRTYELPLGMAPHAIHGTVYDQPWVVDVVSGEAALLRCDLGPAWPWAGMVEHSVALTDDSLVCRLTVRSAGEPFPAQVGWHPWFTDAGRPPELAIAFEAMHQRDDDFIATALLVEARPHPWDDCFVGVEQPVRVRYRDGVELALTSDCSHWVVYEPEHALCVEPQSGPPDGFALAPLVVTPDEPLTRTLTIRW